MKFSHTLRIAALGLVLGAASLFAQVNYDEAPRPLRNPAPAYPEVLKAEKAKGKVVLAVFINEAGDVYDVKVVKSTDARLESHAVDAIKNTWKFSPATLGGKAVASKVNIPVRFDPEET